MKYEIISVTLKFFGLSYTLNCCLFTSVLLSWIMVFCVCVCGKDQKCKLFRYLRPWEQGTF